MDQEDMCVGIGSVYFPSTENIGNRLRCYATPWRIDSGAIVKGRSIACYTRGVVNRVDIFSRQLDIRKLYLETNSSRDNDIFRIVTFNILSSVYTVELERKLEDSVVHYVDIEYRVIHVMKELMCYNADIIMLQECDQRIFTEYVCPLMMEKCQCESFYTVKASSSTEGCAMIVNKSKLEVTYRIDLTLRDIISHDGAFKAFFELNEGIKEKVCGKLGTIAQIVVMRHTYTQNIFIAVNTHLFYHPDADWIRLIQMSCICNVAQTLKNVIMLHGLYFDMSCITFQYDKFECLISESNGATKVSQLHSDRSGDRLPHVSLLIGGDLNSSPDSAAVQYLEG
jgi:mRNA deadenylase 3'-5' endonuclease subunit Ccr4